MTDTLDLERLLAEQGPWTTAYIDGPSDLPEPDELARRRAVREAVENAGAPAADVEALDAALAWATGIPSPSSRFLLIRDGTVELDESFAEPRHGPERFSHRAAPAVIPLLSHLSHDVGYLVVETGRDGATIRAAHTGAAAPERTEDVEGSTDSLPKVQVGGWSQARYQRHTEEVWSQNHDEVAETLDRWVRERQPRFVVVSGDVQARRLLLERISPTTLDLVVEVDANTRAAGASQEPVDDAIADAARTAVGEDEAAALDDAAAEGHRRGAYGVREITPALQQARVDTLLLDESIADAERTLEALAEAPWVAEGDDDEYSATSLGRVPAGDALARAAILTGARVLVSVEDLAPGEPRPDGPQREPVAVLRWPADRIPQQ
ncbi:hypothetical protein JNB62_00645 [Microbacterium jejuense]|uniref:Peptide chain release factor 1 n=1 Tax=Microbacterium jejuense TaxID=1263637 RepID=A0ABS7HIC7_9MICO|nr:Vms1/Ankzf1 family peptidyl-tRNA hydrolase [Microbacterium jejuense]MBW9092185.1 hypothetical protein [Microbacterium jejuense]